MGCHKKRVGLLIIINLYKESQKMILTFQEPVKKYRKLTYLNWLTKLNYIMLCSTK